MPTASDISALRVEVYFSFKFSCLKDKYKAKGSIDICLDLISTKNTNFRSLEVVNRGSETQLQVAENLKIE